MKKRDVENFVEAWGAMGALMGFSASTARVHALLIASDQGLCLDDIVDGLGISRGNASMCLKELRSWGVVSRAGKTAGDRRDYFETESDIWKMAYTIASERKRRDFEPALRGLEEVLGQVSGKGPAEARLAEMGEFLAVMKRIADHLLGNEAAAKQLILMLGGTKGSDE
ncbi:MAG: transcriptional regulator [Deltaproteobacteria bacterium]|nr:transcriptional regulator [Deltaproteobacteria bacterium]MBW2418710.1 transcriptional regulator [Deltaproteobacteria bacterium]